MLEELAELRELLRAWGGQLRGGHLNNGLANWYCKIWNDNSSRDFLDSRGLTNYEENDLVLNSNYYRCYLNLLIEKRQKLRKTLGNNNVKHKRKLKRLLRTTNKIWNENN